MKVLIAAEYRSPYGGNFIGSLLDLASRLRNHDDDVLFLFPALEDGERSWVQWIRDNGYDVILADLSLPEQEQAYFLKRVLRENKIDLLHLHFGIFHRIVRKYSKEIKPTKVLFHDHMGYATGSNLKKQKIRLAAHSLSYALRGYGLITVMEQKKDAYLFTQKKWYVPNGLSLLRNVQTVAAREDTRKELEVSEDSVLCILLGWDMKRKGVDIAVQAVAQLIRQGYPVVLGLVGQAGTETDAHRRFIREYNVDPDSDWIHYISSREDVFSLHRAADVFLSASRNEGFPYGILEAISQNTPVVISDIPETKWATNYEKSVMYPVEDTTACAKAILQAARYGRASSNAEKIIDRYSIEKWCERVMSVYRNCCK